MDIPIIDNEDNNIRIKYPGFVVKIYYKNKEKNLKFFLNVCHSESISPPTLQLDEKDLKKLIENENYEELSKFTIPLVVERLENTKDKKNQCAKMTHVIVNSRFFESTIISSDIYKNYLIYIVINEINIKFNLELDNTNFVILKNKKFYLADYRNEFPKFIYSYHSPNVLNKYETSHQTEFESIGNLDRAKIEEDKLTSYDNLIILLDISKEIVTIKIKLENIGENLKLQMNDDHVRITGGGGKLIQEFNLSMPIKYENAIAKLKNNVLTIQTPVSL